MFRGLPFPRECYAGLSRPLITYVADRVIPLESRTLGGFKGPLATELSDLIRAIDSSEAEPIIQFTELTCPAPDIAQGKAGVNPLSSWASEELVEGAYVGVHVEKGPVNPKKSTSDP